MRTLMLIASIAMTAAGVFCVANGSAAFLTVAFIIGLVFIIMGAMEMVVGIRADFDITENAASLTKDGFLMIIAGIVIITGQITDDITAQMLFGMWMTTEGILAFNRNRVDIFNITSQERADLTLSIVMTVYGLYIFFNVSLLNITATLLIGAALIILGIKRFLQSFRIEYNRPTFITGNEMKLEEALEEEKRALAKAKEGIREQKAAQRRISKIREDMAAEQEMLNNAALRRQERELERELDRELEDK